MEVDDEDHEQEEQEGEGEGVEGDQGETETPAATASAVLAEEDVQTTTDTLPSETVAVAPETTLSVSENVSNGQDADPAVQVTDVQMDDGREAEPQGEGVKGHVHVPDVAEEPPVASTEEAATDEATVLDNSVTPDTTTVAPVVASSTSTGLPPPITTDSTQPPQDDTTAMSPPVRPMPSNAVEAAPLTVQSAQFGAVSEPATSSTTFTADQPTEPDTSSNAMTFTMAHPSESDTRPVTVQDQPGDAKQAEPGVPLGEGDPVGAGGEMDVGDEEMAKAVEERDDAKET